MLDKGYDISSQRLGVTSRRHRELVAWVRQFGRENSYDATGNGLFGGKNCQDLHFEASKMNRKRWQWLGLRDGAVPLPRAARPYFWVFKGSLKVKKAVDEYIWNIKFKFILKIDLYKYRIQFTFALHGVEDRF